MIKTMFTLLHIFKKRQENAEKASNKEDGYKTSFAGVVLVLRKLPGPRSHTIFQCSMALGMSK